MFNEIWGRELNDSQMKCSITFWGENTMCSIKYECENEMFNKILGRE